MSKISILPASRLRNFAALVTSELGVRVHLRGKSIQVRLTKPPVIFLPDMDGARDSELLPIYGFCLHEAGHIRYTNRKVCSDTPNYLVKLVHNAVEDEFIERMLERDFPGAREMLTRAYMEGIQAVFGDEPIVETTSWLSDDRRADVITEMTELGLDATDAILIEEFPGSGKSKEFRDWTDKVDSSATTPIFEREFKQPRQIAGPFFRPIG